METSNHQNPMVLNFGENSVRKTPYSCAPPAAMDYWKLQRVLRDGIDGFVHCVSEAISLLWPYGVVPRPGVLQLGLGLG
ncbi:MAG: hypothetical protein WBW69_19305 [Candidatus Korobacteraceae bacterium]